MESLRFTAPGVVKLQSFHVVDSQETVQSYSLVSHAQHKYFSSFKLPNSYFVTLSFAISFVDAKDPFLLHVTREFHSVKLICRNLYAIIFPCEKSLYSQSEWRTAVFTYRCITDQRKAQRKGLCQRIRIVHRLPSNSVSDFGGFFISASFKFTCECGGKLQICVIWLLPDVFVWRQENKNTSSKSQREVTLLKKKSDFQGTS